MAKRNLLSTASFGWVLAAVLGWLVVPSAMAADRGCADAPGAPICAKGSPWYELGEAEVRVRTAYEERRFVLDILGANDLRVRYWLMGGGGIVDGEVLLIGGFSIALKGGPIEPGYEIDFLDGPVLMMQAVVSLLDFALPAGPAAVEKRVQIGTSEPKRPLVTATPSASAQYGAPWTLKGEVRRLSEEMLSFDLVFTFVQIDPFGLKRVGGPAQNLRFTGTLAYPAQRAGLPDDFDLSDWNVLGLGPKQTSAGDSTILDYGAKAMDTKPKTVADVRAQIKRETDPGAPDPTKNFTGFWKERCEEEDFGLQIKPASGNGKYAISFCGPGGCFEPGTYRPDTYITGDRQYEVVSADEIRIHGVDGWSTYHKCSPDPGQRPGPSN